MIVLLHCKLNMSTDWNVFLPFEWMNEWMNERMNELYSHKPNTYSYREVNNNIQHIKFCTCVEKLQLH
jgi:hypothetical protein